MALRKNGDVGRRERTRDKISAGGRRPTIRTSRIQWRNEDASQDIEERAFEFAVAVTRLCVQIPASAPRPVVDQVAAMGANIGADIAEAYASHSKRTHLSRLESARRLSREIGFWLRLLVGADIVPQNVAQPFLEEAHALNAALTQLCGKERQEGGGD